MFSVAVNYIPAIRSSCLVFSGSLSEGGGAEGESGGFGGSGGGGKGLSLERILLFKIE